ITAANIPNLTFVPNTDVTTQGSFTFKVTDSLVGTTSASAATMTINVTADSGPTAGASTITVTEDVTYTFKASDFVYADTADVTNDPLGSITVVTLPTTTTLKLLSLHVALPIVITAANIPNLTFEPNIDVTTQGSFT